jgi:hypothetical protein
MREQPAHSPGFSQCHGSTSHRPAVHEARRRDPHGEERSTGHSACSADRYLGAQGERVMDGLGHLANTEVFPACRVPYTAGLLVR